MNFITKISAAVLLTSTLISHAIAANVEPPKYGLENAAKKSLNANSSYVFLVNYTYNDYWAYASYTYSGVSYKTYLGPYGYNTNALSYTVNYPDYLCLRIERIFDHYSQNLGCYDYSVELDIGPYSAAKNSKEIPTIQAK